jgi:single stranded DNA-binding protein
VAAVAGVPADQHNPDGHRDVQHREAALALGVRVAVHDSRQNDRNPVIWQPGQDYRAADAIQAARTQPTRARLGPERVGPERQSPASARSSIMAADNHTTIVGNLVDDPELRLTSNGIAVANLRVAVTQRIQQDGEWRDGDTSFLRVNVWRGQAEHLADSLAKGDRVMVTGRLRQRSWGNPRGRQAVGHRDRGRRGRRLPQVGHRQGRTHQPARQRRPRQGPRAASRTRRRLQRPSAFLAINGGWPGRGMWGPARF